LSFTRRVQLTTNKTAFLLLTIVGRGENIYKKCSRPFYIVCTHIICIHIICYRRSAFTHLRSVYISDPLLQLLCTAYIEGRNGFMISNTKTSRFVELSTKIISYAVCAVVHNLFSSAGHQIGVLIRTIGISTAQFCL